MDVVMDVVFIVLIVAFFAASAGLVRFCANLMGKGRPVMNWVYWLSGLAALVIFVYLIVALFKPEFFE